VVLRGLSELEVVVGASVVVVLLPVVARWDQCRVISASGRMWKGPAPERPTHLGADEVADRLVGEVELEDVLWWCSGTWAAEWGDERERERLTSKKR
jgi:hypothetical protein